MPCGQANIPPPKLPISLPDESKWWIGFTLLPTQPGTGLDTHRSVAHTVLPSRSMATPLEPPHALPSMRVQPRPRLRRQQGEPDPPFRLVRQGDRKLWRRDVRLAAWHLCRSRRQYMGDGLANHKCG